MTREDLDPGYQAVQSCHAFRQFVEEHPIVEQSWFKESNYLALLSVPTEDDLIRLCEKATARNVRFSIFKEPDINNEITAIVLEPGSKSRKICSNLPLALGRRLKKSA